MDEKRMMCFADDCLIRVKTKEEAEKAITAMDSLKKFDLVVNKQKSQILAGPKCLDGLSDLVGVPIVQKVKYLGYTLSATRQQLYHSALANIKRHMNLIKAKLRVNDETVQKLIIAAFGRSMLTYFATPLVVNGVWDLSRLSNLEFSQRR